MTYSTESYVAPTSVGLHLEDIRAHDVELLTAEQEVDLAKQIEVGLYAEQLIDSEVSTELEVSSEELEKLATLGKMAFETMIKANVRLSISVAKKSRSRLPMEERVQSAHEGLIHAVKKFDFMQGRKFSTYATWWLKHSISRTGMKEARSVRLPLYIEERIRKIVKTKDDLTVELGREPSIEEISVKAKVTPEEIHELMAHDRPVDSLDRPLEYGGDTTVGDLRPAGEGFDDKVIQQEMVRGVMSAMSDVLTDREIAVVSARLGLADGQPKLYKEISKELGVSIKRVRQIYNSAIKALKVNLPAEDHS